MFNMELATRCPTVKKYTSNASARSCLGEGYIIWGLISALIAFGLSLLGAIGWIINNIWAQYILLLYLNEFCMNILTGYIFELSFSK